MLQTARFRFPSEASVSRALVGRRFNQGKPRRRRRHGGSGRSVNAHPSFNGPIVDTCGGPGQHLPWCITDVALAATVGRVNVNRAPPTAVRPGFLRHVCNRRRSRGAAKLPACGAERAAIDLLDCGRSISRRTRRLHLDVQRLADEGLVKGKTVGIDVIGCSSDKATLHPLRA
jgi:hypothetical protein